MIGGARIDCVGGQYLYAHTYTVPEHDIVALGCFAANSACDDLQSAAVDGMRDLCFDVMDSRFLANDVWRWTPSPQSAIPFVRHSRQPDERRFVDWLMQEATSFRLEQGDLVRIYTADVGSRTGIAVLAHHLVADAVSVRLLLEQVLKRAAGLSHAASSQSFTDYAHMFRQMYLSCAERDDALAAQLALNARFAPSKICFDLTPYSAFNFATTRLQGIAPTLRKLFQDRHNVFLGDGLVALAAMAAMGADGGRWWLMATGRSETRQNRRFASSFGFLACPAIVITSLEGAKTFDDRIGCFIKSARQAHAHALPLGSVLYAPWNDQETLITSDARQKLWPSLYVNYYGEAGGLKAEGVATPIALGPTFSPKNGRIYETGVTIRLAGDDVQLDVASRHAVSAPTASQLASRMSQILFDFARS